MPSQESDPKAPVSQETVQAMLAEGLRTQQMVMSHHGADTPAHASPWHPAPHGHGSSPHPNAQAQHAAVHSPASFASPPGHPGQYHYPPGSGSYSQYGQAPSHPYDVRR
ncbi:hypothetical protein ABBQ32_002261 [Trebouxia sp. C0010 RCD-2024]